LVLRQGSASFYVNPAGSDYFSVTGGDFTVEADSRSSFRIDNYDDGSTVDNFKGHVSVLHNKNSTRLDKGQSLSMKAGDDSSLSIAGLAEQDDFDRWVSGRIDTVSTATSAALQYTGSPYYVPGFADLYSYGGFNSCGSYGYGWRPFGVGYGWSPFTNGQWYMDPAFGWTWMSYQPWGGPRSITEDGSSTLRVAAGSILPRFFTDILGILSVPEEGGFLFARRTRFIIRLQQSSFARAARLA
jgi:hypothetical protein